METFWLIISLIVTTVTTVCLRPYQPVAERDAHARAKAKRAKGKKQHKQIATKHEVTLWHGRRRRPSTADLPNHIIEEKKALVPTSGVLGLDNDLHHVVSSSSILHEVFVFHARLPLAWRVMCHFFILR